MLLLCDLGGTNCRLALARNDVILEDSVLTVPNSAAASFAALLQSYLAGRDARIDHIVIALAAPIEGSRIVLTNHNWVVDRAELCSATGAREVHFLNDFEALGLALAAAEDLSSTSIQNAPCSPDRPRIILGAGTGFNCAAYLPGGSVATCEAGHSTFAAVTELDTELRDRMTARYGRCSTERLLSGSGYLEIYSAIAGREATDLDGHSLMLAGLSGEDPVATQACRELARMLGQVSGDLALLFWAKGGVWLSGGPTRALAPMLVDPDGAFLKAFRAKGRMEAEMKTIPVWVLNEDTAALHGCLERARSLA